MEIARTIFLSVTKKNAKQSFDELGILDLLPETGEASVKPRSKPFC